MEKVIKFEGSEYENINSNRFLVKINSKKLEIKDWLISSVEFDNIDKKILSIIINDAYNSKTKEYKLMPLIDKCMNDYTNINDITVSYLDAEGNIVYNEVFEDCKIDTYHSLNLDYCYDFIHRIRVNFRFKNHKVKTNVTTD